MTVHAEIPSEARSNSRARPPGSFFVLEGMMARLQEQSLGSNPHQRGSAKRKLWRYGWQRRTWPKWNSGRNASCETAKTGRGRSRLGKRSEYSDCDDEILRLCFGWMTRSEIADILERSPQSVANRANRLDLQTSSGGGGR